MRCHFTQVRMATITKSTNKCWRGCEEKGTLVHCWWECRLVQPLWKTVWNFLKKLKMELSFDPAIPLLGLYTKNPETLIQKRAILSRANGVLIRALWLCLSGFMPKSFRRQIKSFIAEISVRNRSTRPCCLGNSPHWAPLPWVTARIHCNKDEKWGQGGSSWSHHGQRPIPAKDKSQSSPMGPYLGEGAMLA